MSTCSQRALQLAISKLFYAYVARISAERRLERCAPKYNPRGMVGKSYWMKRRKG